MKKSMGFTLLELMVVLSIIAILTMMAVPSFKQMIQSTTISSAVNTFLADMRYARSESIRRGGGVVMCRSDAPEATNPECGSKSGPGDNGWVRGWIIFYDQDGTGDRTVTSTDPVLRVQAALTQVDSIVQSTGGSSTKIVFTGTGRLKNMSSGMMTLQFGGGKFTSDLQRTVCVSIGGQARIAGDGNAACG